MKAGVLSLQPMAWILNLETASTNCSVALFEGSQLRALREDPSPGYSHGELLHVFIEEALAEAGVGKELLDAVAVSKGPGSYTGLRIGVASAKGLCFSLDIPLIALPTLKVLAAGAAIGEGLCIPMLDARRMEVYAAILDPDLHVVRETRAEILTPDSFEDYAKQGPLTLVGNGAEKARDLLTDPVFRFLPDIQPSARFMGPMAYTAYETKSFEDLAYFEPYYLKDFIATRK